MDTGSLNIFSRDYRRSWKVLKMAELLDWIDIFNQVLTDAELATKYKKIIEQSTVYATTLSLSHGRYDLAYDMLKCILKTGSYETKNNEVDLLVLRFPSSKLKKVISLCDDYSYDWKMECKFSAVVKTHDETYIDEMITTQKLAFQDQYTSVADYRFILENGSLAMIMKYYSKVTSSIFTFMKIRRYLAENYLRKKELAERPSILNFLCEKGMIKMLNEGPYAQKLYHIITKWNIVVTDMCYDKEEKIYSFAYNLEDKSKNPVPNKLESDSTDNLSYKTIESDELYLSCTHHKYSLTSIKDYIISYNGDSTICPYCFSRINHTVYINK